MPSLLFGVYNNYTLPSQTVMTVADYAERYYCDTHGTNSNECRAWHQLNGVITSASVFSTLGGAVRGKDGAAIGGLVGLFVGLAYPAVADWMRMNGVLEETRTLVAL